MSIKLRIAGGLAVVVISGLAILDANACACGVPDWASMTIDDVVSRINQMPDNSREYAYDNGYLPDLSNTGFMYAEDFSVVPVTYNDPTAIETATPGCYVFYVDQPNVSQELIDYLYDDQNWRGDPTDGHEALYSPSCW